MSGAGDISALDAVKSEDHERVQKAAHHRKKRKEHASTGASAATIRAVSAQLLTFYFRAPVKAFFRPRIE
jgi:hypothetical protein